MHAKFIKNSLTKEVKIGFSWTVFFFGALALLIRKQYGAAVISFLTFGLANFYFMFAANKMLAHSMIECGWTCLENVPQWGIVAR